MPRRARGGTARVDVVGLADRLHSTAIHLLRRVRRVDAASGLPAPHLSALSVIVYRGPLTLGELAAAEGVRPPTMTRVAAALARDGLIVRESDPQDRRAARVRATAKGKRLLEQGRGRRVTALVRELEALPQRDILNLDAAVTILRRVLDAPTHDLAPSDP